MATPFSQTTRALESDGSRRGRWVLVLSLMLLGVWCAWAVLARLDVRVVSPDARVTAAGEPRPIQAEVGGRVVEVLVGLGERVAAGQVLVQLDASRARAAVEEAEITARGLEDQVAAAELVLRAAEAGLSRSPAAARAAEAEARALLARAKAEAAAADEEWARTQRLAGGPAVSPIDLARIQAKADQSEAQVKAARQALRQVSANVDIADSDRTAEVELRRQALAEVRSRAATARAVVASLQVDVDRHAIRAPVAGVVGELSSGQVGAVASPGTRLGTVIPDGELQAVAGFLPGEAVGRVRVGQPARLRLQAFSWTAWGDVPAVVSAVASEPRDGRLRVELALDRAATDIPLEHGLLGTVEVDVERISPAALLLRSAGQWSAQTGGATPPPAVDP